MKTLDAPFSREQVELLKLQQGNLSLHPLTCCGEHCVRNEREDQGILIPTTEGLVCLCGKMETQLWAPLMSQQIELEVVLRFVEWVASNLYFYDQQLWTRPSLKGKWISTIDLWNKFLEK